MAVGAFATSTLLIKNSFIDEIRKQYVTTARAKGLTERGVLYGHVFRNAMLLVIASFPAAFIGAFFGGSLLIETIFSLDGLGPARLRLGPQPRLFRGVCHALHLLAARPRHRPRLRPHVYVDRSAHRFRKPGTSDARRRPPRRPVHRLRARRCGALGAAAVADQPAPRRAPSPPTGARSGRCGCSSSCSPDLRLRAHRQRPAADRLLQGRTAVPRRRRLPRVASSAASSPKPSIATPSSPTRSTPMAG